MFLLLSVWVRLRVPKLTSLTYINSSSSMSEDGVRCSFNRFVRFRNKNSWHTLRISFGVAVAQLMLPFAGTFAWAGNANSLARLAVIEHPLKRVYVRLHSKTNVLLLKPDDKNVASWRILQIGGIFISVQLLHLHFLGEPLPLPSLRLLVPPVQLMMASMWQVLKKRDVLNYWKVAEYVSLVVDMVPELLMYKHRIHLNLGLRARVCMVVFTESCNIYIF